MRTCLGIKPRAHLEQKTICLEETIRITLKQILICLAITIRILVNKIIFFRVILELKNKTTKTLKIPYSGFKIITKLIRITCLAQITIL